MVGEEHLKIKFIFYLNAWFWDISIQINSAVQIKIRPVGIKKCNYWCD
jgi:hypothetical protein